MLEAELDSPVTLQRVLESIKDFVQEASWECSSTGMCLATMDSSHVSLVMVMLTREMFSYYKCDKDIVLSINLLNFYKILKFAQNDDIVTISAGKDVMVLRYKNKSGTEVSEYELKLMDLENDYITFPQKGYTTVAQIPSQQFHNICRDFSQISDSITISCSDKEIVFEASGILSNGSVKLIKSEDGRKEGIQIKTKSVTTMTFAARFLSQFGKAASLSDWVQLRMMGETVLMVRYPIKNKDMVDIGYIKYYLAPKITD